MSSSSVRGTTERSQEIVDTLQFGLNSTKLELPNKCVHELFEERVNERPDGYAVICEEESITYRELNQRANRVAHYLQSTSSRMRNPEPS